MRHFLANIVTYTIAAFLIAGAAAFAWMRSAQLAVGTESDILAQHEPAAAAGFDWSGLGSAGYERNCANCHRSDGRGWDQYPAVTGAHRFAATDDGMGYLIDLHLYGLTSSRWGAPMPPMAHMLDVELAAVINHVVHELRDGASEGLPVLRPEHVRQRRDRDLSPRDVNARRPDVP
jgi:cytochrome c5